MQPIFREPPVHPAFASEEGEPCLELPLLHFEVPVTAVPTRAELLPRREDAEGAVPVPVTPSGKLSLKGSKKRGREEAAAPAAEKPTHKEVGEVGEEASKTCLEGNKDVRAFLEFGVQSYRPSKLLVAFFSDKANPAALLSLEGRSETSFLTLATASTTAVSAASASVARSTALVLAVRQALSIVSRVVALDTAGVFLLSVAPSASTTTASTASPPPPPSGESVSAAAGSPVSSPQTSATASAAGRRHARHGFLQLYCVLGGVELELEDLASQLTTLDEQADRGDGDATNVKRQNLLKQSGAAQQRAGEFLDAFERTVLHILLDMGRFTDKAAPSREYVAQILRSLPSVFEEASWPTQLLASSPMQAAEHARRDHRGAPPGSALERAFSEGISAILLEALGALERADRCSLLLSEGETRRTPITVTAARLYPDFCVQSKQRNASGGSKTKAMLPPPADLEAVTLSDIKARAWCGLYGHEGLRRANKDVQLLFHKALLATVDCKAGGGTAINGVPVSASSARTSKREAGSAAERAQRRCHELLALREVWDNVLHSRYMSFLAGQRDARNGRLCAGPHHSTARLCDAPDVFALSRASRYGEGKGRSKVQEAALNVLKALKASDKEGWFAVPAFDLVNVDFSSVKCWVEGADFATKSPRAAFDAFRRVLERMVDACVRRYGPTHQFSQCIVSVRQHLVDAARREGLLL